MWHSLMMQGSPCLRAMRYNISNCPGRGHDDDFLLAQLSAYFADAGVVASKREGCVSPKCGENHEVCFPSIVGGATLHVA